MGILNTFTLDFVSNASKARADIASLGKEIEVLKDKGRKRSEEETKDMKAKISQQKELMDSLKDSTDASDKLVDSITSATSALVGFAAVRAGISNSNNFNSDLEVQSKLLRQNAQDLKTFTAAAELAGGSKQGALGDASRWYNSMIQTGITDPGQYTDALKIVREKLSHISDPGAQRQFLAQWGFASDAGTQNMLLDSKEWNQDFAKAAKSSNVGNDAIENARETNRKLDEANQYLDKIFSKISSMIGPTGSAALTGIPGKIVEGWLGIKTLGAVGKYLRGAITGGGAVAAGGEAAGGAALEAAGGVGLAAGAGLTAIVTMAAAAALAIFNHKGVAGFMENHKMNPFADGEEPTSPGSGMKQGTAKQRQSSLEFWMSQGYSRAQAAGIVANEQAESGGDPNARGDGGKAVGLFQWHPDRVLKIMAGTGIDVRTASREDQLRAAAWELQHQNGFNDQKFRGIQDPSAAGSYFSQHFEVPAAGLPEAIRRGQMALGVAGSYTPPASVAEGSGGGNVTHVHIDKIEVQTQADDAQGVAQSIGLHLTKTLGYIAANVDDGVNV